MFDIGWSEMTVVVVIALLVLGPKQLPEALKTITQLTRKARRYAQDFRSGIDNIVREAELEDAREALNSVKRANPSKALTDLIDPTGEVNDEMRDLEDTAKKSAAKEDAKAASASTAETDKSEEAGAKTVKAPEAIAPSNSIRPPPGPDVFASAAPAEEAEAVPAVEPPSPPPKAKEPEPEPGPAAAPTKPTGDGSPTGDGPKEDGKEDGKSDERRQA